MEEFLGRTIEAVITTQADLDHPNRRPQCQIHLVFTDGTTFEIYGGITLGGGSRRYRGNIAEVMGYQNEGWEMKVYSLGC